MGIFVRGVGETLSVLIVIDLSSRGIFVVAQPVMTEVGRFKGAFLSTSK